MKPKTQPHRPAGQQRDARPRGGLRDLTNTLYGFDSLNRVLPMPAGNWSERTKRECLHPGAELVADALDPYGKAVIDMEADSDLKGTGMCADLSLAAANDRLGLPTSAPVLRDTILDFAETDIIFDLHVTRIAADGSLRPGMTIAAAICDSLQSWPPLDYERAVPHPDEMGEPGSREWQRNMVNAWIKALRGGVPLETSPIRC